MRCLFYDDVFVNNQEKTASKHRSKQGLCTHWFVALSIMNLRRHMNTEEGDDEPLLKMSVETGVSAGEEIECLCVFELRASRELMSHIKILLKQQFPHQLKSPSPALSCYVTGQATVHLFFSSLIRIKSAAMCFVDHKQSLLWSWLASACSYI